MNTIFKIIGCALGAVASCILAAILFGWWSMESHPVPPRKVAQIHAGMSADSVEQLLGTPRKIDGGTNGTFAWTYGHPLKWSYFSVAFSVSSNVVSFREDD